MVRADDPVPVRKWYRESSIIAIADAIRTVDGIEDRMLVSDMPTRILALPRPSDVAEKEARIETQLAEIERLRGVVSARNETIESLVAQREVTEGYFEVAY